MKGGMHPVVDDPTDTKRERFEIYFRGRKDAIEGREENPPSFLPWRFRQIYFRGYKAGLENG